MLLQSIPFDSQEVLCPEPEGSCRILTPAEAAFIQQILKASFGMVGIGFAPSLYSLRFALALSPKSQTSYT